MKTRKFQPGLKYVFSYKKYKQDIARRDSPYALKYKWPKHANGQPVTPCPEGYSGHCGTGMEFPYMVIPEWCKCIGKEEK